MNEKILFVAFSEPEPIGSNRTAVSTVLGLQRLGRRVEMFTCHKDGTWRGPRPGPDAPRIAGVPHIAVERVGIPFHVVAPPDIWCERILTEKEWEAAVSWGVKALEAIRPDLLHLQQWQYLWWMMESAIRLGIPVVHSVNDYGLACLRTILVMGDDTLCDGRVEVEKCSRCIVSGRNLLGKANEFAACLPFGERMLSMAFGSNADGLLARRSGVRMPVRRRVKLSIDRARRVFGKVEALITASPFARGIYPQFGVPEERIHVMPWFYDQEKLAGKLPEEHDTIRMCLITRVSPEKGVHILLDALKEVRAERPVELRIFGAIDTGYGREMQARYPGPLGKNRVAWCGWIPNDKLPEIYADIHVAVIPSLWYDNTPLTLVEALAHGRPVICTDVPSMTHLVKDGVNGLVFPMGDVGALKERIERIANQPELLYRFAENTRNGPSLDEYVQALDAVYRGIFSRKHGKAGAGSD